MPTHACINVMCFHLYMQVKSILDSINLLLSDPCSPFISIVAVDSRIAVKSIENEMGASLIRANVNGYEYLKKIINLPLCIPKVKLQFCISNDIYFVCVCVSVRICGFVSLI